MPEVLSTQSSHTHLFMMMNRRSSLGPWPHCTNTEHRDVPCPNELTNPSFPHAALVQLTLVSRQGRANPFLHWRIRWLLTRSQNTGLPGTSGNDVTPPLPALTPSLPAWRCA